MPGLAAGFYTLLPAHYALLPGAYAVSAVAGTRDMTAATNHVKTDGNWVVAGYRGSAVANDSRWSGFLLTSGDQVHKQSAFSDYSANTFLASSSPMDGGHVVFDVTKSLSLDGLVRLRAASGGRNGIADISAPEIAIVSERSDPLPVESAAGTLKLTVSDLTALGADSLLLGAVRTTTSAGDRITVGAANVIVENDAAHPLSGPEIIVAATDNLILKDGSAVAAQGALSRTPQNLLIVNKSAPTAGADGALLRVSSGAAVALQRRYTAADGSVSAPAGVKGTLDVGANVTLAAGGSVMLDATKSTVISSTLALSSGTALGLGASRIMLGDDAPVTLDVLRFDTAGLLALNSLSSLALTSYSTIDVYGGVTLGDVAMQNLSFSAGGMRGMLGVNVPQATFTAQTIRFDLAGTDAAAGSATGSVVFAAKDIEIGNGAFALHGFSLAALNASNEIRAAGVNGKVGNDADLTLRAGRITARGGKDATVTAGGRLTLTQGSGVVGDLPALELGGRLTFEGQTITSDASIVAVAGRVSLTSTATVSDIINGLDVSDGTLNVAGGIISAAGGSKTFGSTLAYAPAGSIALDGGAGNVNVGALATLDVSAVGANAGRIAVTANNGSNGQAALNGALKGSAVAGVAGTLPNQGQFALDVDDVGSLGQFTALNDKLNASGFTESRSVRVRLGDIVIADKGNDANGKRIDAIKAHQLVLAADYGDIALDGSIDASGAKGGSIELYAAAPNASSSKGKVQIGATALLKASATQAASSAAGSSGDGGRIVIGTSTTDGSAPGTSSSGTSISLVSGARFNVAASGAGQDGSILLRAPRLSGNDDVAISVTNNTTLADASAIRDSNGNLLRNGAVTVEGYKVYSSAGNVSIGTAADTASHSSLQAAVATSGEAATAGKMYSESSTYLGAANRSAVQTRLGATVAYQAGVEVRAAGDINVSVNESVANAQNRGWDLNVWRFGDQAGVLTLRAGGNLNITGSISDGFVKPVGNIAMPGWELDSSVNGSWSYRLAGGADLAAANPLDVKTAGNVSLAFARSDTSNDQPVALIRSGTGRIDIAAGRDVTLGAVAVNIPDPFDNSSTVSAVLGASIYTAGLDAGRVTGAEGEFLAPRKQNINSIYANGSTTAQTTARFATDGGAISITAGGDVVGAITSQLVNAWLFRRGKVTSAADGSIVFDGQTFPEATAVPARRYENVLSTGWWSRYDYFNQGVATFAGGDITVTAAGNFRNLSLNAATSGQVPAVSVTDKRPTTLVERGGGDIIVHAGGDIRGGSYYVQKGNATLRAGGSVVAGDNTVADDDLGHVTLRPVLAVGDGRIDITAMGNVEIETVFNPTLLLQSTYNADVNTSGSGGRRSPLSVFSTYKDNGAITLTSLSGDVYFGNHVAALSKASVPWITNPDTTFIVYPASLRVTALSGSIILDNGFSLWPSPVGQLELLAEQSVRVAFPRRSSDQQNIFGVQPIAMIDAAPASLPSVLAPRTSIDDFVTILNPADNSDGLAHHTSTGLHAGDSQSVRIVALTGDIVGENYFGGSNGHVTLIVPKAVEILAGRDIRDFGFKIQHLSADDVSTITAGRDFIDTTFPDLNPVRHQVSGPGRLDITAGRDIDLGTSSGIVTRGNLDNPYLPDAGASINLVAGAKPDYANFANLYLTADELPLLSRNDLVALNDIFFKKLRVASGADGGELDLPAFDAIIASLFPTTAISGGNINVFGSQVKTARGGAINLFSPGGSIQAGLAEKPAWVKRKLFDDKTFESNLGVYTIAGGNLQSLVKKDFLVNQGRVFTLGGGDITLVSQYGDIDAGKGAKTAQSTPPPVIRTDATGNTIVDISGSISGSGIATLRTAPDVPASSVYPIAPRGIFDAGDAGVRSTGSVNIVAATVLNASNISAAGTVSGTNTTDTSGLSSAISAPINTTQTRTEDIVKSMENQSAGAGGTLNVEVIGFGSDQQSVTQAGQNSSSSPAPCKANDDADVECKKNRKQP